MLLEPFDTSHVLTIVGMNLAESFYQAQAELLIGHKWAIYRFLCFCSPKEKVRERPITNTPIEWG